MDIIYAALKEKFEKYSGLSNAYTVRRSIFERLNKSERLVVDCKVPKILARVVLREQPIEACREILDTMTLYGWNEPSAPTWMAIVIRDRKLEQKEIGVDTVTYLFEADGRYEELIQKEMVTGEKP